MSFYLPLLICGTCACHTYVDNCESNQAGWCQIRSPLLRCFWSLWDAYFKGAPCRDKEWEGSVYGFCVNYNHQIPLMQTKCVRAFD